MILKGGKILKDNALEKCDIRIASGRILSIGQNLKSETEEIIDVSGGWIIPGGVDVHVHLREPGYAHKETIYSGTKSAAKGGITSLMAMPNIFPVPDSIENLEKELNYINKDAIIKVFPYASLTVGQKGKILSDIKDLSKVVLAFSDDGYGVNDSKLLKKAMCKVKEYNRLIASHAERITLGMTRQSEIEAVKEEIELVEKTRCKYHFCHLSTKESFEMLKAAKSRGLDISAEVTPHHLFLNESNIKGNTLFKMNPPLRSEEDRIAAMNALLDGTVDIVATDHAPHLSEEKAVAYELAPNGIIGLETMLPLLFTRLIKTGLAKYQDLINWTSVNPSRRFGIPNNSISLNEVADITVLDIENERIYCEDKILSKGKNSPFIGEKLYGMPILTLVNGKVVYAENQRRKK